MKLFFLLSACGLVGSFVPVIATETNWPISPEVSSGGSLCKMQILNSPEGHKAAQKRALLYFLDPACLSSRDTKLSFEVRVLSTGLPRYKVLASSRATRQDIFYCTQAIWEACPSKWRENTSVQYDGTRNNVVAAHAWPELQPDDKQSVKLHFVPASVMAAPGAFITDQDIQATENVVRLPVEKLDSKRLDEFRKSWISFIQTHPKLNRAELLAKVTATHIEFKDLFEAP